MSAVVSTPTKVLIVGSYNAGLTMSVDALPRAEQTVLGSGFDVGPGGKGANQAIGAARLGADVLFVTKLGRDDFGALAAETLAAEGLPPQGVLYGTGPTGVAFIMSDPDGRNMIAVAPGANEELDSHDVLDLGDLLDARSLLVLQLECRASLALDLLRWAKATGRTTVLNPAPFRPLPTGLLALVDILTPNAGELAALAASAGVEETEPLRSAEALRELGVRDVIVTLGHDGVLWDSEDGARRFPAHPAIARDTTGAGDAFTAGLVASLAAGGGLMEAIELGCRAGAFCVTRDGVIDGLPTPGRLDSEIPARIVQAPSDLSITGRGGR